MTVCQPLISFLEVHFWEVVLDVAVIVLVGKLLEARV